MLSQGGKIEKKRFSKKRMHPALWKRWFLKSRKKIKSKKDRKYIFPDW
jgi:hypothetical protein